MISKPNFKKSLLLDTDNTANKIPESGDYGVSQAVNSIQADQSANI